MNDKRAPRGPRFPSFVSWFGKLPLQMRVVSVGVLLVGSVMAVLPKSLFNSFTCRIQNAPQNDQSSNGYYIDNQVIVVGPRDQVDLVIGTPSPTTPTPTPTPTSTSQTVTPGPVGTITPPGTTLLAVGTPIATAISPTTVPNKVILKLIEGCDLSYLDSRKDLDSKPLSENRNLVMRLYEIPENDKLAEDVVDDIHTVARGKTAKGVLADPNYLISRSDFASDPCALPSDGGGGGGKPFGDPGTFNPDAYDATAAEEAFKQQWAFGPDGVDLSSWPASSSSTGLTGRDVRVAVFDTSPFRRTSPFVKRVGQAFPSPLWFTNWDVGNTTRVSNHGLFVASLIHMMAPNSSIQLVRVLNEDGCGDLWALNKGLEDYKSRMSAWTEKLDDTVLNMSIGIHLPNLVEDNDSGLERDDPRAPENDPGPETETAETTPEGNNEDYEELETLKSLITAADDMGAIIVAAAGNDSPKRNAHGTVIARIVSMQAPASFDNVVGVAATAQDGTQSCFSNYGDVSAPGGQGGIDPQDSTNTCAPRAVTWNATPQPCSDMQNCEYGLVGLAQTRYGPRYMLWSGTSFAAPLVSGLAALAYEELTHDQVECLIYNGTRPVMGAQSSDPNKGLINIPKSLSTTLIDQCRNLHKSNDD